MDDKKTNISLLLLVLNDLFRAEAIDRDIYDKAAHTIASSEKGKQTS